MLCTRLRVRLDDNKRDGKGRKGEAAAHGRSTDEDKEQEEDDQDAKHLRDHMLVSRT